MERWLQEETGLDGRSEGRQRDRYHEVAVFGRNRFFIRTAEPGHKNRRDLFPSSAFTMALFSRNRALEAEALPAAIEMVRTVDLARLPGWPRWGVIVLGWKAYASCQHGPASQAAEPVLARTLAGEAEGSRRGPFLLEALVDFPDDALQAGFPLTPQHIDRMMARLAELGIRRVAWGYYGDGHGGYLMPEGFHKDYRGGWKHYADTCRQLGSPLKVARAA